MGHLKGGGSLVLENIKLIDPTVFFILILDEAADHLLISIESGDVIPMSSEMRTGEIFLLAQSVAGKMDSTFAFDVTEYLQSKQPHQSRHLQGACHLDGDQSSGTMASISDLGDPNQHDESIA